MREGFISITAVDDSECVIQFFTSNSFLAAQAVASRFKASDFVPPDAYIFKLSIVQLHKHLPGPTS